MGLDMYLEKHTYVARFDSERHGIYGVHVDYPGIEADKVRTIIEEIGYWRKANQIHGWIVEHCAKGVDECQEIYMPEERIEDLLGVVKEVLAARTAEKALELLPPCQGFFFGAYDIDQYYWEDLEQTVPILERALQAIQKGCCDIYYRASW